MDSVPPASRFLSTLSLRRATLALCSFGGACAFLSTLSLRRATVGASQGADTGDISIHALLAESDLIIKISFLFRMPFLSTLSLRRATMGRHEEPFRSRISIHALLAESDVGVAQGANFGDISIHALLAESDVVSSAGTIGKSNFYPRSPCGERLYMGVTVLGIQHISIHALLAESDPCNQHYGGREVLFLSTLSLRRATCAV